ncbi:MAG: hypothetical protein AAGF86_02325 [Pseudomonadota bacterium]
MRLFLTFVMLAWFGSASSVAAAEFDSTYTKLNLKDCQKGESNDDEGWANWMCAGYKGIPIYFGHADLREFVGYGPDARNTCSARTTFQRFNAAGTTVEWRLRRGRPVATILRFRVEGDGLKEQFLVVTKLDGAKACPMGYVDARVRNHNQAARDLADQNVARFSCGNDVPLVISPKYDRPDAFATAGACLP